jgi:transcriptional antiterminator RfaH
MRLILPRIKSVRLVRGRKVEEVEPLFTNYLFLHVHAISSWYPIRSTPGVARLLMACGGPVHVRDTVIADLRSREIDGLVQLAKATDPFPPGTPVKVRQGPLAGLSGLVDGMRSRDRIAVLLTLLGGARSIELSTDTLEVIPPPDEVHAPVVNGLVHNARDGYNHHRGFVSTPVDGPSGLPTCNNRRRQRWVRQQSFQS